MKILIFALMLLQVVLIIKAKMKKYENNRID